MQQLQSYLKNKTHVIFDWNGTLFNDVDVCVNVIQIVLKTYQLPTINKQQYLRCFRFPVIEYYKDLGFDFDKHAWNEVAMEFIKHYQVKMFEAPLYKETLPLLKYLKDQGIVISILSAQEQTDLKKLVSHHEITEYFDHICGLDNFYASSKIDVGRRLINKLDVTPSSILFIGDTDHDVEVAGELGVDVVLYLDGHQDKDRLNTCSAPILSR